jgi:hypothetical protein
LVGRGDHVAAEGDASLWVDDGRRELSEVALALQKAGLRGVVVGTSATRTASASG